MVHVTLVKASEMEPGKYLRSAKVRHLPGDRSRYIRRLAEDLNGDPQQQRRQRKFRTLLRTPLSQLRSFVVFAVVQQRKLI